MGQREETNLLRMFLFSFDCLFLLNPSDLMELGTMNLFCSMFYFGLHFIQKWNKPQTQIQLRKLCLFLLLNWKKKEKKKTTHLLSIKKWMNTKEKSSRFSTLDPQESKRKDPDLQAVMNLIWQQRETNTCVKEEVSEYLINAQKLSDF